MKCILLLLLCINLSSAYSQGIVYTHRTTRLFVDDGVIVVPEIGGMNHLWIVTPNQRVRLQVYNRQLEWQHEQILALKLSQKSDVTILPLKNEYLFYNQSEAGNSKFLWRIDKMGNVEDVSRKLKDIIKSTFTDSTVVCQLYSKGSNIYLVGNIYFPSLKKIITTLILTNAQFEHTQVKRYAFGYDHTRESLLRMLITPENNLVIMKEHTTPEMEQELNVLKIDLTTSKINGSVFKSQVRFDNSEILYNPADSSTTLCAFRSRYLIPRIFFSTLNDTLEQKLSPITIRVPISEEMYGAFACVNTGTGGSIWLPVYGNWNSLYEYNPVQRILVGLSAMVTLPGNKMIVMNASSYQARLQAIDPYLQNVAPPGDVRFSVVNLKNNNSKDTVFKYYRRLFIEVSQYTSFMRNNNSYLVVKQKFRSNGKGILLLSANNEGRIIPSPLRVYERYHYAIPQLQQTPAGNLMIPYVYKSEVGLANVALDANQ